MENELAGSVRLVFVPSLTLISLVRRFVQDFSRQLLDEVMAAQLALTTHELLENVAKYALDGEANLAIDITNHENSRDVVIFTRNRAAARDIENVERLMVEMKQATDPFTFYQTLMRRSMREPLSSGLGLARLAVEAGMNISYEIEEDMLVLRAECVFPMNRARS